MITSPVSCENEIAANAAQRFPEVREQAA